MTGAAATATRIALSVLLASLIILPLFSSAPNAFATNAPPAAPTNAPAAPAAPAGGAGATRVRLTNPLGAGVTIEVLVGRAIRGFGFLSGSFALLMFVYGGFMWVTSGGNMDKVKKGKQIFTWATIGLIVIFGSYAFLANFMNAFGG
ncbi:MAG: Type secretion system pilin [Candidatus Parcubacteria bacterium]